MKNIYKDSYEEIKISPDFKERTLKLLAEENNKTEKRAGHKFSMKKYKALTSVAAAFLVVFIGINAIGRVGCGAKNDREMASSDSDFAQDIAEERFVYAESYNQVYEYLNENNRTESVKNYEDESHIQNNDTGGYSDNAVSPAYDYPLTTAYNENMEKSDNMVFESGYIYYALENKIYIFFASRENSYKVSEIPVFKNENDDAYFYINEIYVSGDILIAVKSTFLYGMMDDSSAISFENTERTSALIYDISNKTNPELLCETGQDGNYIASAEKDGILYLATNYNIYNLSDVDDIDSYIPKTYRGGNAELIEADNICVIEYQNISEYSIISSIDTSTGEIIDTLAVLGGENNVYMNEDNLYLYASFNKAGYDGSFVENVKINATNILRIELSTGSIDPEASGSVFGNITDHYSINEYNGYLRAVTTVNESGSLTRKNYGKGKNYNCVYSLDKNLDITGSIENLAAEKNVHSTVFDGDICYLIAHNQNGTIYAADLSNYAQPEITSQVLINGYLDYLKIYGDGLLFGFGRAADNESEAGNIKLYMFDTTDKFNIREKYSLTLDFSYSEALYNHRLILISADKNIIALPDDDGYTVYAYDDGSGFYLKGKLNTSPADFNSSGVITGEEIYIINSDGLYVFDIKDLSEAVIIPFN